MTTKKYKSNHNFLHVLLLALSFLFIFAGLTFAQESPQKYGITFPISELGGCKDVAECRSFCDDPVNRSACISFAKQKGFYNETGVKAKREELVEKAKAELGCTSAESCRALCEQAENREKCFGFAQRNGLAKAPPSQNSEIVEKAKALLGCDSAESCRNFCSQAENRDKCTEFAKEAGLKGGKQFKGPGGCTSEETCKALCSDPNNFGVCSSYGSAVGKEFKGPGGCTSPESCRSYCESNPDNCRNFSSGEGMQGGPASADMQAMCNRTPSCSFVDNTCKCNHNPEAAREYEKVCKENPDMCRRFSTQGREDFCKQNPDKCGQFQQHNQDPQRLDDSVTGGNKRKEAEDRRRLEMERRRNQSPQQYQHDGQQPPPQNYTPPSGTNYQPPADQGGDYQQQETGTYTAPPPTETTTEPLIRGASQEGSWLSSLLQKLFSN